MSHRQVATPCHFLMITFIVRVKLVVRNCVTAAKIDLDALGRFRFPVDHYRLHKSLAARMTCDDLAVRRCCSGALGELEISAM
jgi:hypothetical protein